MVDIPVSVPSFTVLADDVDDILASHQNTPNGEITALATMVGMLGKAQSWGTDIIGYLLNQKIPIVTKKDADEIYVSAGAIVIGNSGQTFRLPRRNTSVTTVSASNIDTGSMVVGFYYIYAVADTAATTFTVKFSASATAPTGLTNYELIGWFYNEANGSLDITSGYLGNTKRFGVRNILAVTDTTDTSVTGDTNYHNATPTIRFYAPSRKILVKSVNQMYQGSVNEQGQICWSLDGTDQTAYAAVIKDNHAGGSGQAWNAPLDLYATPAADTCVLILRLKTLSAGYTSHVFNKVITVEELS